jgi:hypothetical protein
LEGEVERWRTEHNSLIQQFVSGEMEPISVDAARSTAVDALEQLHDIRFPSARTRSLDNDRSSGGRRKLHRGASGLDTSVLQAAFARLDLQAARTPSEAGEILGIVRDLLSISLGTLPTPNDNRIDELDDLPCDFDNWVFQVTSRSIVQNADVNDTDSLWRPILDLGPFGHHWVEYFFWQWFSDGVAASPSPEVFVQRWSSMIRYALASPVWSASRRRAFDLDAMVFELLGFHWGARTIAPDEKFALSIGNMSQLMSEAASRWFTMGKVAKGFAQIVIKPAFAYVLCPGIQWLAAAVTGADDDYFWRESQIESHLVEALQCCWERHHDVVAHDESLRTAFKRLLTVLSSRGSHAAMALAERVLDSISQF